MICVRGPISVRISPCPTARIRPCQQAMPSILRPLAATVHTLALTNTKSPNFRGPWVTYREPATSNRVLRQRVCFQNSFDPPRAVRRYDEGGQPGRRRYENVPTDQRTYFSLWGWLRWASLLLCRTFSSDPRKSTASANAVLSDAARAMDYLKSSAPWATRQRLEAMKKQQESRETSKARPTVVRQNSPPSNVVAVNR